MRRSKYSRDLMVEALQLSDEIGIKPAAEKLGIPYEALAKWRKSANRPALEAYSESRKKLENVESLEREVQELKRTNAILLDTIKCLSSALAN